MNTDVTTADALGIAVDAYLFGYPLQVMELSRQVMTAVPRPNGVQAPINQFLHLRSFPEYTMVEVTNPNADTLYSTAWLDVSQEPMILSLPPVADRYQLVQLTDAWTNVVAALGSRTRGSRGGDFAVVGPRWRGTLPSDVQKIESPTDSVWVTVRTQITRRGDFEAVHALQDRCLLRPLSAFGTFYSPPKLVPVTANVDVITPPARQVARMDAGSYFRRLCSLMAANPPSRADAEAMARFSTVGIGPGRKFDLGALDPFVSKSLAQSVPAAREQLQVEARSWRGRKIDGWQMSPERAGRFGLDYVQRAVTAMNDLGASLAADHVWFRASEDRDGQGLVGSNRYRLRFPRGELPPVNGFWSLTMYDSRHTLVPNGLARYSIGDRDPLQFEKDGSLVLSIQQDPPEPGRQANWLPAPPGSFSLMLRLYWPRDEVVARKWRVATIQRLP